MFRHEMKFVVDGNTARVIAGKLKRICRRDQNAGEDGLYRVSSLYFDDYCDSAVADSLGGQYARRKFRIRIYNGSDSFIRLERKIKRGGGCRKDTARLTREQYGRILSGDIGFMRGTGDPVWNDFYLTCRTRLLRPRVVVDYVREAYVYRPGDVRVTLDRNVRSSVGRADLFGGDTLLAPVLDPRGVILEIKYTGFLPGHIQDLMRRSAGVRQAASKYTMSRMSALTR